MSALPPLYAAWIAEALPAPLPSEPAATCDDCAMQPDQRGPELPEQFFFSPATKCCTFMPHLHNFLAGRILDDPQGARDTLIARIESRRAVTPLGLGRTPAYADQYSPETFGRNRRLRCPHYLEDGGLCGVWRHRESTCATWFCKHERGKVGLDFWESVKALLAAIELSLARHCAIELGAYTAALQLIERSANAFADHADLWGNWLNREQEYYRACAELIAPLTYDQARAIGGAQIPQLEQDLRRAYLQLYSGELPERARVGSAGLVQIGRTAWIHAYRAYDPLALPAELGDALSYFDGRPLEAATRAIEDELGLVLTRPLLQKLVDFGILEAAR